MIQQSFQPMVNDLDSNSLMILDYLIDWDFLDYSSKCNVCGFSY
jgi:hypothetical protein